MTSLGEGKPLKAYLNVLKMRINMAMRRTVVANYPVMAMVEPSLACNLRCPACPTGLQLGLRPAASLDPLLYRAIIDEIGDYVFHLAMYNWGEPLLHKETPEFVAYAKARGISITMSSNLSLKLTDDYVERLVKRGSTSSWWVWTEPPRRPTSTTGAAGTSTWSSPTCRGSRRPRRGWG